MPPFRSPLFVFCSHHPQPPNPRARTPVLSMSEALIAPLRSSLGRRGHRRRPQEGSNAASEAPGGSPWRVSLGASQLPLAFAKHIQTQPSPGAFTSKPRHSLGQLLSPGP